MLPILIMISMIHSSRTCSTVQLYIVCILYCVCNAVYLTDSLDSLLHYTRFNMAEQPKFLSKNNFAELTKLFTNFAGFEELPEPWPCKACCRARLLVTRPVTSLNRTTSSWWVLVHGVTVYLCMSVKRSCHHRRPLLTRHIVLTEREANTDGHTGWETDTDERKK